jgi:hypothetical protein
MIEFSVQKTSTKKMMCSNVMLSNEVEAIGQHQSTTMLQHNKTIAIGIKNDGQ